MGTNLFDFYLLNLYSAAVQPLSLVLFRSCGVLGGFKGVPCMVLAMHKGVVVMCGADLCGPFSAAEGV